MAISPFIAAINQISDEKVITRESIIETIEAAIAAAYRKDYGTQGQIIQAKLDPETGEAKFSQVFNVVEKEEESPVPYMGIALLLLLLIAGAIFFGKNRLTKMDQCKIECKERDLLERADLFLCHELNKARKESESDRKKKRLQQLCDKINGNKTINETNFNQLERKRK